MKGMKKVLFAVVALGMLTSCVNFHYSKSTRTVAEENRQLKGFERIELRGSLDVKYMQSDSFSVKVNAPLKVLSDVETRVEGDKLIVYMKGEGKVINFGVSDSEDVTVYVTSPDFLGIELRGSGDFECRRLLDTDNLDIVLNGSGDIMFEDIICDQVNVSLVGSGDVNVRNVKTLRSKVNLVGSGDVMMNYDNSGKVEASLTGSGDITLRGTVSEFRHNVRGSGDINMEGLRTEKN